MLNSELVQGSSENGDRNWFSLVSGDILRRRRALGYTVKEIFYSLQGEGANAGRAALFCRFAGCNLWSGKDQDRQGAICKICDTDFVGSNGFQGGYYATPDLLTKAIGETLPTRMSVLPLVVLTGGEPLLQADEALVLSLHESGFQVAVETNGTMSAPRGLDWICVSPKPGTDLKLRSGDELKLVFPQEGLDPEDFEDLNFRHFFLQPLDDARQDRNVRLTVDYCRKHPKWRLSLQIHKLLGIR